MAVKGTRIQQAIPGTLCPLQTTMLYLHTQHIVQSTSWVHNLHTELYVSSGSVSGEACCGMQSLEASQHAPLKGHARGCPSAIRLVGRSYPGEWVLQSSTEAFFCLPEPPKGMFAHQPSCSHGGDSQLHSTSMEFLLPAIENNLISPTCQVWKG